MIHSVKAMLLRYFLFTFGIALPLLATGEVFSSKPDLPSDIPAKFVPKRDALDYERRMEKVPMHDGVKLHTVILVPKGAKGTPIILNRTPYDATQELSRTESSHLASIVPFYFDTMTTARYIIVAQDVRGKHKSEGSYVINRPPVEPLNASDTDHATDTFDTID